MTKITGIIASEAIAHAEGVIRTMAERMAPRASSGDWICKDQNLALGWTSSPNRPTNLPYWNENRRIGLILNGELYPDSSDLNALKAKGHAFSTDDASFVVHLYEERGLQFAGELNGWFSGLLVDLDRHFSVLFNDRYGLGRIYFHQAADSFYFASEAKALLRILPEVRRFDPQGVAELINLGCPLQNRTLFNGISLLPGGSLWIFHQDGRIQKQRYFSPEKYEQQTPLDPVEFAEQLSATFTSVLPRYLLNPAETAISLTGGLDSRMLMAWAQPAPGSLPSYTFGGPFRDCADVRIAKKIAGVCRQPHTTIRIARSFFDEFPVLAEQAIYLSDGVQEISGAVELYVNRLAAAIAPVRLTGNYGTEILRSNIAFKPGKRERALFTPEFQKLMEQSVETYRDELEGNRLTFIAFKQVPWYHYALSTMEKAALTPRSPFLDNDLVGLAYRAPSGLGQSYFLDLIARKAPYLGTIPTDRALTGKVIPVISKVANACQEFTAKAEYAYDYGMPATLARIDHCLAPLHLERLFLGHHKFYHFRVWYRDQLSEYVRAIGFNEGNIPFCYRPESVSKIVNGHLSGRFNRTSDLHKLLTIQLVQKLLIDSPWEP